MRHLVAVLLLSCLAASPLARAQTVEQAAEWFQAKDPRADAAIASLLKSQPDSAEVWVLETRRLLRQGKTDKAVDAAEEAVERNEASAQAQYWLGNAYGSRITQVGMLSQAMMAPKLRDAFERAVALDPELHDARTSLVEYYLQAPAVAGGSLDKAKAQTQELLKRDPPRGHYAAGRVATFEKKPAEAATAFAAAYRGRPENNVYRMAAGVSLQQMERWDEAFALFEAWAAQDPKAAMAWYQIGRTSALSGQRLPAGAEALKRYLTFPAAPNLPTAANAQYRLGQVQAQAGDKDAARASFQAALKGDPGNADIKAALSAL
jgi:tetratricopeptide (TPR) repeat protein